MFPRRLLLSLFIFGLMGALGIICPKNSSAGQNQEGIELSDPQNNPQKTDPQDEYQFFLPVNPPGENKYIILEPDGKTPSDYHKFLYPMDQGEGKSKD